MESTTPMLRQYQSIKSNHKDSILFYRLGDFYEMFYDDAKTASSILDLVLTSRDAGKSGKVPMCGIPYHAADSYIARLIKTGQKVAICEQVEDPAQAKGLVKRDVTRIITTGTFIDDSSHEPRYLLCVNINKRHCAIAFCDPTGGTIQTNQYTDINKVINTISKLPIYECIFPSSEEEKIKEVFSHPLLRTKKISLSPYEDWAFNYDIANKGLCEHFQTQNLKGFGIDDVPIAVSSAGALLEYLRQMNRQPCRHIDKISLYTDADSVFISPAAVVGLEIEELIETIDNTLTPLGRRMLRDWVYHPLKSIDAIKQRQDGITFLKDNPKIQQEIVISLRNIPDVEKNLSRLSYGYVSAKDILALRNTLARLPEIQRATTPLVQKNSLFKVNDIPELRELLEGAVNPEVPLSHPDGKLIKKGYDSALDSLKDIQLNGNQWLKNLQQEEITKTRINSLKIGFNKVFGYYIEVSNANLRLVPADYIRKQTLVNAERYITPGLKEFEEKMLTAESEILRIEEKLLRDIQKSILDNSTSIHVLSSQIATIDSLYSLCQIAKTPGYIAPEINEGSEITIKDGRHPVVERYTTEQFVPNDTLLDCENNHLLIITGPNMAGKSTYIRQCAILVIMAQIGSYIPTSSARIGIVDKIFTRIGARDDIAKGQSTFMVEMSEAADILNNLTSQSLIILDEVGRGTSTYDGLSLAWAIAEYLQNKKTRTLFATHFHELTALAEDHPGVRNYNVAVKEWKEEIVFLHKIVAGGCDDSYGIYVAKIAGVPKEIIARGKKILTRLEIQGNLQDKIRSHKQGEVQLTLFSPQQDPATQEIKGEIDRLDIDSLTPIEALNKIQEWKAKFKEL